MKLASFYIFVLFVATHFATADKIHKKEYRKSYREALKPYLLNRWDDSNFLENFWGKLETVIKDDAVLDVLRQMGSFFEKFVRTTKQSSDLAEVKFTTIPVLTGFHEGTPNAGKERKQPLEGLKKETGNGSGSVPVVLWHGMGDCCCNPLSMGSIKRQIERQVPGIYVHSLMIGNNIIEDTLNGFIMNVNDQVTQVCEKIKNDSNLANGYHAWGLVRGASS
ncbi:uncharacterized protein LOC134848169 [Symsagittifera roscoffensis]|uniref:uncharacterized protein LOC134848169 n=1 Tax=Symsagittifera roscoffensis TaxID=84072 RepID=UPI00307B9918